MSNYLNSVARDTSALVTIPNALFAGNYHAVPEHAYTIALTLTNFLQQTSRAAVTVTISPSTMVVPKVQLYAVLTSYVPSQAVSIVGVASLPSCAGASNGTLLYTWKVFVGLVYDPALVSSSRDPKWFSVPPFTFKPNTAYTVQLSVKVKGGAFSSTAETVLRFGSSGIAAVITGARVLTTSQELLLDASQSLDQDNTTAALNYRWSCTSLTASFGSICTGFPTSLAIIGGPQLSLPIGVLPVGSYVINATVSDSLGRSGSTGAQVSILSQPAPTVQITAIKAKYNSEDKVFLSATVNASAGSAAVFWACDRFPSLAAVSLSALNASGVSGIFSFPFAIAPYSLISGLSYTFSLSAAYAVSVGVNAQAFVSVLMNSPPSAGSIAVNPVLGGTAFTTSYKLTAFSWQDDVADLPLSYSFVYWTLPDAPASTIKGKDIIPYTTTTLGQGLQSVSYIVNICVRVFDIHDGQANASTTAQVLPVSTSFAIGLADSLLTSALHSSDASAVLQTANIALNSLNAVDCNTPYSCSALNRQRCSGTARTCGACLSGYAGVSGDANLPCNTSALLRTIGFSCSTGWCMTGHCADVPKACAGNCLGNGNCLYHDLAGNRIGFCSALSETCTATCACFSGFNEQSCGFSATSFNMLVTFREKLCASLYSTMTLQDINAEVATPRAITVANILLDPYQLSLPAIGNCTAVLVQTISDLDSETCRDSTTFTLLADALSAVLQRGHELPSSVIDDVHSAAVTLSRNCQGNKAVGEEPSVTVTSTMKLLAGVMNGLDALTFSIPAPLSAFESFSNISTATMQIVGAQLSKSDEISVTLLQLTMNPRKMDTAANSLYVDVSEATEGASSRRLTWMEASNLLAPSTQFIFTLPDTQAINYTFLLPSVHVVRCFTYRSTPYNVSLICPIGQVVSLQCPAFGKGTYNVSCPGFVTVPVCVAWNGTAFAAAPECEAIAWTAESTTCACSIASGSSGRRLQTSLGSTSMEISVITTVNYGDLSVLFTAAPDPLTAQAGNAVVSTCYGLIAALLVGLIAAGIYDSKDASAQRAKKYIKEPGAQANRVKRFDGLLPFEFQERRWFDMLGIKLMAEHSVISLFGPAGSDSSRTSRMRRWMLAISKLTAIVAFSTILVHVSFADDGYCERFDSPTSCADAQVMGVFDNACLWLEENETCVFARPALTFLFLLVMSGIVLPAVVLLMALLKILDDQIDVSALSGSSKQVVPMVDHGPAYSQWDELVEAQTVRGTILRAARLEKARAMMDDTLPSEEALSVAESMQHMAVHWDSHHVFDTVQALEHNRMRFGMAYASNALILSKVLAARRDALDLCRTIERFAAVDDRESVLIRSFIVNCFSSSDRMLVQRCFFQKNISSSSSAMTSCVSAAVWLAILLALFFAIYLLGQDVGSRSLPLWTAIVVIALMEELLVLEPAALWLKYVVINGSISEEARLVCEQLRIRSKLILLRTTGLVRHANAMVQHFNPACRVARMFPAWPVSRLLFSVNDHDVPLRPPSPSLLVWPWITCLKLLKAVICAPGLLGSVGFELTTVSSINALAAGLYFLYQVSSIALWCALAALFVCIGWNELLAFRKAQQLRWMKEKKINEGIFEDCPQGLEANSQCSLPSGSVVKSDDGGTVDRMGHRSIDMRSKGNAATKVTTLSSAPAPYHEPKRPRVSLMHPMDVRPLSSGGVAWQYSHSLSSASSSGPPQWGDSHMSHHMAEQQFARPIGPELSLMSIQPSGQLMQFHPQREEEHESKTWEGDQQSKPPMSGFAFRKYAGRRRKRRYQERYQSADLGINGLGGGGTMPSISQLQQHQHVIMPSDSWTPIRRSKRKAKRSTGPGAILHQEHAENDRRVVYPMFL